MSDLIRREDVLNAFNRLCGICGKKTENNGAMCRACSLDDAIDIVEDIPTAEPKAGKWIEHPNHIECPNCKVWFLKKHMPRNSYCPNCGAKMERSE